MTVSAQAGVVDFGPQSGKGVAATNYYRHRATLVDIDVADAVNEGQPEVGGIAVPTFPYKSGPVVGGGFTLQPRLENSIGWLLYGMLGYHSVSPTGTLTAASIVNAGDMHTVGSLTLVTGSVSPVSMLCLTPSSQFISGSAIIAIAGTDTSDAVISEMVTMTGAATPLGCQYQECLQDCYRSGCG